jgi:acyl-CoA synthetase (NDP forming)
MRLLPMQLMAAVDFAPFLEPKSVAIIGASRTPGKPGYLVIENLKANEYAGKIYPVNPQAREIMGYKAYPSVADLPEAPDVAVVLVPASATIDAVRDCVRKGIKAAVIESGGYAEVNDRGVTLERELVRAAEKGGMRIIGPNTSGIISTPGKFTTTFYPLGKIRQGSVAYLAQTGNFATHTMRWILSAENFGVSRVVGLGNKCDVDDADVIEYFGEDPETRVICMYMEGFKDGRRFVEVAKKVSKKKPMIALMGGVTGSGVNSAASHTASLGESNPALIEGIFKQAGVVSVHRYTDLIDSAKALAFQPLPAGGRVGVIVPSGGMGVIAADTCVRLGLTVAELAGSTLKKLQDISEAWIRVNNPVDIWSAIQTHSVAEGYRIAMEALLDDPGVDSLVAILALTGDSPQPNLDFIPKFRDRNPGKPVLIGVSGDKASYEWAKKSLEGQSVPVYLPVEGACEALATMYRCSLAAGRGERGKDQNPATG